MGTERVFVVCCRCPFFYSPPIGGVFESLGRFPHRRRDTVAILGATDGLERDLVAFLSCENDHEQSLFGLEREDGKQWGQESFNLLAVHVHGSLTDSCCDLRARSEGLHRRFSKFLKFFLVFMICSEPVLRIRLSWEGNPLEPPFLCTHELAKEPANSALCKPSLSGNRVDFIIEGISSETLHGRALLKYRR